MINKKRLVLFLTGCIFPNADVPMLKLTNSTERAAQTYDAITFFIERSAFKKIVYCDNSNPQPNEDLIKLAAKKGKELEWLGFNGDREKVLAKGKGYGEGEIIKYALENSRLIDDDSYIVKLTARVIIKNINLILFCLRRNRPHFSLWNTSKQCDTRFYGMPVNLYKKFFLNAHENVDDINGVYLEGEFRTIILSGLRKKVMPFVVYPDFDGVSGTAGCRYNRPWGKRVKLGCFMYLEKVYYNFPDWWAEKAKPQLRRLFKKSGR